MAPASVDWSPYLPDLLNHQPGVSIDREEVQQLLWLAFASGDSERQLDRVMDRARLAPTRWVGSSFREGLYVDVLLSRCMAIDLDGFRPRINREYLLRILENPPADLSVVHFRQQLLGELVARESLRQSFVRCYKRLCKLRIELQGIHTVGYYDSRVRRLYVLGLIRDLFFDLRASFGDSESGLRRISAFGEYVGQTEAFRHLCDLLDYEDRLSLVQFQMRLGADGRMRKFSIVNVRENQESRFYQSPLRRYASRLSMWFLGYKVGESGLLDAWLEDVFAGLLPYLSFVFQLLGDQEFYLAGLAFHDRCRAAGFDVAFPNLVDDDAPASALHMQALFNPLLLEHDRPVPCHLSGPSLGAITIVTGPNSGGKTRLLQAVGVAHVFGESGLHAPVASATIRRARGLFVSLTSEDGADQTEGRLGTELVRIRRMFECSSPGVLVLVDELCSGTNPSEGEEIFALVLSLLQELGARALLATHFLEFARRMSHEQKRHRARHELSFLQVVVAADRSPTYQFDRGVAGTSMAHEVAERLGVTDSQLRRIIEQKLGYALPLARSASG